MNKIFLAIICLCLTFAGLGCDGPNSNSKPIWEDTKLSDLATAQQNTQTPNKQLRTINLQIQVYEIPSDKVDRLDDITKILTIQPFRFNRANIFNANGFSIGFGRENIVLKVIELLKAAGGNNSATFSLRLEDGQTDYIPDLRLLSQKSLYYTTIDGKTDSKTIGPGVLSLRMTAQKSPVFRATYNITAVPAVPAAPGGPDARMQVLAAINDVIFESCSFSLQISPGDFFFLRPLKYAAHGNSLGSLFFSRPGIRPVALAFLVVCVDVTE